MPWKAAVTLVSSIVIATTSTPAQARIYWDGEPVFSTLETWELIFYGAAALALASLLLFTLVKLINRFFGPR